VQHIEVQILKAQSRELRLEAFGGPRVILRIGNLRGDEQRVPRDAAIADRDAYLALVHVGLRGVDVPVSCTHRGDDGVISGLAH